MTTKRARSEDFRRNPEHLVTNAAFTYALRYGRGPLTPIQRITLFVFGVTSVAAGLMLLAASFTVPASLRQATVSSGIFYYVSSTVAVSIVLVVGFVALALGVRTLRHVIWRAS